MVQKLWSLSLSRDSYLRLALEARWDGWFWIAELHNCVVGWGFRPRRDSFVGIYVDRDFRGLGVGKKIAAAMVTWSRLSRLPIYAYPFDERGAALYAAAGIAYQIRTTPIEIAV